MIPLMKVHMSPKAIDYIKPVLSSGYVGEGPNVVEFERRIGSFIGNQKVLAMNSCTSAITVALRLAGVERGDYVITTPMTCLATNEPILSLGAIPFWADVDETTGMVTKHTVCEALHKCPRAKAIIIMHWGGYLCDIGGINEVATDYDIPVIEDAAQAIFAQSPETSDFTCLSFQAIKQLTTCDGGALVCRDLPSYDRGRLMRWFGLDRFKSADMRCHQDPPEWGYKFQMNDVAASIGMANLDDVHRLIDIARRNARVYDSEFTNVRKNYSLDNHTPSPWVYTIHVNGVSEFISYMASKGIAASQVHDRNDKKLIFRRSVTELPGVDSFDKTHVCIPVGWWLTDSDIDYITETVKSFKEQ